MGELFWLQQLVIIALPAILAITLHEAAHGYVAHRLGDSTAYMLGRVTLNPMKHIDPVGTLLIPLLCVLLQLGIVFGWAKPVPINFANLKNPKRDMVWVALAGPLVNLFMAIVWILVLRLSHSIDNDLHYPLMLMAQAGVSINIIIMILNLIPIPPLDGGRILIGLLPNTWAYKVALIEPYGLYILLLLIASRALDSALQSLFAGALRILSILL